MFTQPIRKESIFDLIYQFAKTKNEKTLIEKIKRGASIGVIKGDITPIALLAKEGDKESVTFLIDKFKASLKEAVCGYARGRHEKEVFEILASIEDTWQKHEFRKWAILGFAQAGDLYHVSKIFLLEMDANNLHELRRWAVRGYARGGFSEEVKHLFEGVENQILLHELKIDAVHGFAQCGNDKKVKKMISNEQDVIKKEELITAALRGFARGGFVQFVNEFLYQEHRNGFSFYQRLEKTILGYAQGGYINEIRKLITLDNLILTTINILQRTAVKGLATAGWVAEVNGFLLGKDSGVLREEAAYGFAAARLLEELNKIFQKTTQLDELENLRLKAIQGFVDNGHIEYHPTRLLNLLSHLVDHRLRKLIVDKAKEKNFHLNDKVLLSKAKKLHTLMKRNHIDYSQALEIMNLWSLPLDIQIWFLQGKQLVTEGKIPLEVLLHVGSFVLNTTNKDTNKIFFQYIKFVPKSLYETSIRNLSAAFFGKNFGNTLLNLQKQNLSADEYLEEQKAAFERYQVRMA